MTQASTPTAEDLEDARGLPWEVLDRAIARYEETRRIAAAAERLGGLDARLAPWVELEVAAAIDARYALTRAILATTPGFGCHPVHRCERLRWPARAIRSGGRVYLVAPDPDREGEPGAYDRPPLMILIDVDQGAVLDFTPAAVAAATMPGPIGAGSPAGPAPAEPPRPVWLEMILRTAMTLGEAESIRRMFELPPARPG